ncbi:PAS domain S-box protein [Piscinibacter sp.]|uniref:PAS domain-containing hybrid sensor histidine kinase/response regulator n=1 Tax=Piscinibacter sp. TaxID=1903157 RepID=UPI00355A99A0
MRRDEPLAAAPPAPTEDSEPPGSVRASIGRCVLGAASAAALLAALAILALAIELAPHWRGGALVAALLIYSAGCGWATRSRDGPREPTLFAAGLFAVGLTTAISVVFGDGLRNPTLGFGALAVCMLCSITHVRWGLALAATCAVQVAALAWAEQGGWTAPAAAGTPLQLALLFQSMLVASGVAGGTALARVLDRSLAAAADREQRFRGLLRIAVDWYWEQDEQFRFTAISDNPVSGSQIAPDQRLGRRPWEIDGLGMTDSTLDAHRADLEAHRPFCGTLARCRDARGRVRYLSISGEPKRDAQGRFCGYWGVGRDITTAVQAQRANAASETRYRELFERSPSPLLLHRKGVVIDANDAAARLFGFEHGVLMKGHQLTNLCADGEPRDRLRQRIAQLEALPVGQGLPVEDLQLVLSQGGRRNVQASAVRVESADGAATLSLYFDVTARVAAEAALRRSETMLSHLFATSPDCITLTEMATGRYALVNDSFVRVTGYAVDEVVGRTSTEIGIWSDLHDRERFVAAIRAHGRVEEMPIVFRSKSGVPVSMLVSGARFEMDERDYLVINARDVTQSERQRIEHEAILRNAVIGIAFSRGRYFLHTNPSFERIFGWQAGQLAGQPTSLVWPTDEAYEAMRAPAWAVLSQGLPYELECEMRRADGTLFWCHMRGQAVDKASPGAGTIWTAEDVTLRREFDQALAAARDAAEAANRAKSAFLANTSHEIRTPLNGLLGMARLAMLPGLDEARRQQYLLQIFDSAQSLSGIISDILDLSKIEAGKITLESVPFGLRDLLVAVHDAYLALAQAKGLEFALAIDDTVPAAVRGDPVRLRQILSNYVTNALKFTECGRVGLHAGTAGCGRLRFSVTDTGPGIAAATQQRLFSPFSQADDSTTRRYGGTGLGLSICRELARLMGGEVGVDSVVGNGSSFWAELPLEPAAAIDTELPEQSADAHAERLSGARVLMVEDNPVNMMIAVAMLEQWGVHVTQAMDGRTAIDAVERSAQHGRLFDVVLMDVQMPHMSGHEAASALRRRFDASELPIIALTAAALVSERDQAFASGMNEFLTKPIDAQRLKETLARAVPRRAG